MLVLLGVLFSAPASRSGVPVLGAGCLWWGGAVGCTAQHLCWAVLFYCCFGQLGWGRSTPQLRKLGGACLEGTRQLKNQLLEGWLVRSTSQHALARHSKVVRSTRLSCNPCGQTRLASQTCNMYVCMHVCMYT